MISILIASRRNDKFLSKLIMSILAKTKDFTNIEVLIMASKQDEWNHDLLEFLSSPAWQWLFQVFYEDKHLGRYGLDVYMNELAAHAKGDWLWYLCSDHDIILKDYDEFLVKDFESRKLDPTKINIVIPGMKDCGGISHIVSRGWYNAAGRLAGQCYMDCWFNDVSGRLESQNRVYMMSGTQVMTDYTPRYAQILSPEDTFVEVIKPPEFLENDSPYYQAAVNLEVAKLEKAIGEGK
jgi:hypothetical protein